MEFTENYEAVRWAFDLSRNSSLRTLETTARSIKRAGNTASCFLKAVLSTITSARPLNLLINYDMLEVHCHMPSYIRAGIISPSKRTAQDLVHLGLFKVYSEIYVVRGFQLVLCADVSDRDAQDATRALECIIKEVGMNGGLDYLSCEPLIIFEMRTRITDSLVGVGGQAFVTCAL